MQRLRPKSGLALALLSALLLVNDGFTMSRAMARALEDSPLPPVVATEGGNDAALVAEAAYNKAADSASNSAPPVAAPNSATESGAAPKDSAVAGREPERVAAPAEPSNSPKLSDKQNNESSQKPSEPQAAPSASVSPAEASSESAAQAKEKDLKSLLENKNDAENDLASPAAATATSGSKKVSDELPVSVIADSDKPNANNDRFHYSLSGVEGSKPESDKSDSLSPKQDNREDEKTRDENGSDKSGVDSKPEDKPEDKSGVDLDEDESEKDLERPQEDSTAKKGTDEAEQAPTAATATATTTTTTTAKPLDPTAKEGAAPAAPEEVKPEKGSAPSESVAASAPASSSEDNKVSAPPMGPQAVAEKPAPKASAPADHSRPSSSETDNAPEQAASPVETVSTTTTTTVAPTSTSTTTASKSPEPKPSAEAAPVPPPSSPAATDTAAAAAAGAAVGTALATGLAGKDKPAQAPAPTKPAATSTTSTTTKAPLPSSTTRRSSINRWNSWSTSSSPSTSSPSTRRRPILPSIRRRFRPYNVFPWAMPESYSPLEPALPDAEPDFAPAADGSTQSSVTLKPKRRPSSTTSEPPSSTSKWSSSSVPKYSPEETDDTPNVSTRRRAPDNGGKRRNHNHHHHHRHHFDRERPHHHTHRERFNPEGSAWADGSPAVPKPDYDNSRPFHHAPPSTAHHAPRHNKHRDTPFSGLEPFAPNRPPHGGFGLFNSAGGGISPSSAGSGFDLLNPFSWIDEMTKPRPPLHNHPRPSVSGDGPDQTPFRQAPSHVGTAARPSGQRPVAFEGDYNEAGTNHRGDVDRPQHDHRHHRPHGRRPVGGSRDEYEDSYDCHGHGHGHEHEHEHEHEHGHGHGHGHDHDHDREDDRYPRRPYRPSRRPVRPLRDEYDDPPYNRPGRPISGDRRDESRRDENAGSENPNRKAEATGHHRESTGYHRESTRSGSPVAAPGERLETGSASSAASPATGASAAGPRRVPSSVFSPFDTLFGSLDDDLFGGLRSSFIDAPLKAAAETIRQTNNAALDAIISSPKISLPHSSDQQTTSDAANPQKQASPVPQSARVIMAKVDSNEPAVDTAGKPSPVSSSERKSVIRDIFDRIESIRMRREQLLKGGFGSDDNQPEQAPERKSATPPTANTAESPQQDSNSQPRVELPPPITTLRGGIKHFLLMI